MESSFKQAKTKQEAEAPKKKFIHLLDEEQVEIKRLTEEDIEECVKVMRKCAFDVTEVEVANIDGENKRLVGGDPNALYMEDPAVLLAYEGRGIRRILVKEREQEATNNKLAYSIAYLSEDAPTEKIEENIMESGNALEKLYLSEGYEFDKTDRGIMAVKNLIKNKVKKEISDEEIS